MISSLRWTDEDLLIGVFIMPHGHDLCNRQANVLAVDNFPGELPGYVEILFEKGIQAVRHHQGPIQLDVRQVGAQPFQVDAAAGLAENRTVSRSSSRRPLTSL